MVSLTRFNERDLPKRSKRAVPPVTNARPSLCVGIKAALNRQPETENPRLKLRVIGEGVGE